jgi:hypothetical protein
VLDPVATVELVATADRETVELAPPHPASASATATPQTATPRTRDRHSEDVAAV